MGLRRPPAALIWPGLPLLYLLLPGHPLGLLGGLPLRPLAVGAGLAIGLCAWCGVRPGRRVAGWLAATLGGAIALKLLLAATALPYGLAAEYRAGTDSNLPPERSTEWRLAGATRIDRSLDLVADAFPVHFVNDLRRFNFFRPSEPRRDLLPFSATWRGWLTIPESGRRCFQLEANGTAVLRLASDAPIAVQRAARVEARELCAEFGADPLSLELRYERPQDGAPYLRVSELESDSQYFPISPDRFVRAAFDSSALGRDRWLGRLAWSLDVAVLVVGMGLVAAWSIQSGSRPLVYRSRLGGLLRTFGRRTGPIREDTRTHVLAKERALLSSAIFLAFCEALVAHGHFQRKSAVLSGGNDWLAYESFARDVLLNGLLMNGGKPPGEGETFYYQPLYSYFLAGLHALLGESLWGVLVAQHVLVVLAGVFTYYLARELFGRAAAWAAFGLFWIFRYLIFNQVAGLLLSENLVAVLVPAMLLLLVRWQRTWQRADLVGGGALLGLAILTRSTPLLFLPPAMLLVGFAQLRKFGNRRAASGAAVLLFTVTMAVASLVAARNYVVAGRPALLPESTSANLWEAHRPSAKVDLSGVNRDPFYNRLGLDRQTREVLEFARQDPLGYGGTLAAMGLYALGMTGPALGTNQVQYELLVLTALYLAALLLVPATRARPAWLLHAFVGTHFLQMMVFMSHQYGFRLPLPMYGPMIVIAGAFIATLLSKLEGESPALTPRPLPGGAGARAPAPPGRGRGVRAALATALVLALAWSVAQSLRPHAPEAEVFGLGGDAAAAARAAAATPAAWRADRIYFSGADRRSRDVAYLPGLAYRDMQWLDTSQALVWPAEGKRGVLVLAPGPPTRLLVECWAAASLQAGTLVRTSTGDRLILPIPASATRRCFADDRRRASFGGLIDLVGVESVAGLSSGQAELRAGWRVIQPPSFRVRLVAERLDAGGSVVASRDAEPYRTGSWERGELIVARITVPTDGTTPASQLAIGFSRGDGATRMSIDDPLPLYGKVRVAASE